MRDFLGFLLLILPLVIFLRIDFFFTVVYFLVAVYILSRLWMQRAIGHLVIDRQFVNRAFTGVDVKVDVTVRNTDWLPVPWLEVAEALPLELRTSLLPAQALSLAPHEVWRTSYSLTCKRRGYYPVGPLRIRTGDLLGLQGAVAASAPPARMTVYPRVVPLQSLGIPTRSPMVALPARSPVFEDPSRVMGVRDYQRGDSPRRIHWSSTARAGKLLVKQYQPAVARETLICLDLDEESYELRRRFHATELAIITAASIATHIVVKEGLPVGLALEGMDPVVEAVRRVSVPPRSERSHLMANVLEVLARIEVARGTAFADLLRHEGVNLSWGSTVVVITGHESDELMENLLYLHRTGFSPQLVLVQPLQPSERLRQRSGAVKVPVYHVWQERDLETWR